MIDLFAKGLPDNCLRRGDIGSIGCRLCGRRFRKWNGTASHALVHDRLRVKIGIEDSAQGGRYTFQIQESDARYFND